MINQTSLKSVYLLLALLSATFFGHAQECTLDIGGKNYNTIIDIFQMNAEQQATLEKVRTELQVSQETIEAEIQKLFSSHPQSTQQELATLSDKYRVLKDKMVDSAWESDKKVLATFNPKQYERYLTLCSEALRNPIEIIPVSYKDSLTPE